MRQFLASKFQSVPFTAFLTLQRSVQRSCVHLPAWITLGCENVEHVAFVRDISPRGMFFYSDFKPTPGADIALVLEYLKGSNRKRLNLKGRIVRLEEASTGGAVGIALRFDLPQNDIPRWAA